MSTSHPEWVQRMRRLQHRNGWSDKELARRSTVSQASISYYVNGKRGTQPRSSTLVKFARVFNEPESLWLRLGGFDGTLPA